MITLYIVAGHLFRISAVCIVICAFCRLTTRPVKALPFIFIAASAVCLSAYIWEAISAFGAGPYEKAAYGYRIFGTYWWAYWIMFLSVGVVPQLLWIPRIRNSNIGLIFVPLTSIVFPLIEFTSRNK